MEEMPRQNHFSIMIGLVAGGLCGAAAYFLSQSYPAFQSPLQIFTGYVAEPIGQIFLRLLFMIVIPLVFASLAKGVAHLEIQKLGKIGLKTALYFILVTALTCLIGLVLVNLFKPGVGFDPMAQAKLLETFHGEAQKVATQAKKADFGLETFIHFIPKNPFAAAANTELIPWIVFTLFFGLGLGLLEKEKASWLLKPIDALNDVMVAIVGLIMKMAPIAVFCLLFTVTGKFGWLIIKQLLYYVSVVLFGYLFVLLVVYPLLISFLGKMNPLTFYKKALPVLITAFSTSSSAATLPTTLKITEEELKVSPDIAGFVLPLGTTLNMNGTALFEGVAVLFLAQVFGVELSLGSQLIVLVLAVISAIGAAGVPGGSIPLLALILATVGVPPEGLAIILGVDRILDMGRTVLNVCGDMTAAVYIQKSVKT